MFAASWNFWSLQRMSHQSNDNHHYERLAERGVRAMFGSHETSGTTKGTSSRHESKLQRPMQLRSWSDRKSQSLHLAPNLRKECQKGIQTDDRMCGKLHYQPRPASVANAGFNRFNSTKAELDPRTYVSHANRVKK